MAPSVRRQVYIIDGWDTTAASVAALKAKGGFPVCYFSAGTAENWRPDYATFSALDMGAALVNYPAER